MEAEPVPTRNCKIRTARPEEAAQIRRFHEEPADKNLLPRSLEELQAAAGSGLLFVVQDATPSPASYVAVAGVFDIGNESVVELGGTLVAPSARGFGLQGILFGFRIAAVILNEGPEQTITTAIDPGNGPSLASTMKAGFEVWGTPVPQMFEPCGRCDKRGAALAAGRQCCCDYYAMSSEVARIRVRELLDESTRGYLERPHRKRPDDLINLEIQWDYLTGTEGRRALEEFASGAW